MFAELRDITPDELVSRLNGRGEKNFAFLLGNGINRFAYKHDNKDIDCDWKTLLKQTARELKIISELPELTDDMAISFTEYYSLMVLRKGEGIVQKKIIEIIESWLPTTCQNEIRKSLVEYGVPVLSLNFDSYLDSKRGSRAEPKKNFLSIYYDKKDIEVFPYNYYWADAPLDTVEGFGIWHVNGSVTMQKSLHLGMIDYAKMIARISEIIEKCDKQSYSWISILLSKKLCIIGAGMDENEIVFRSLLLRKVHIQNNKKYKHLCHEPDINGWYCYSLEDKMPTEKVALLKAMRIIPVMFDSRKHIYEKIFGIK